MKQSRRQHLRELKIEKENCKWEEVEIHHSQMDPDMKGIYLNDLHYKEYCIDKKIEDLEHQDAMFPLQLMLLGFIIFVIGLIIYRIM